MAAFLWVFLLFCAVVMTGAVRRSATALKLARMEAADQKQTLAQRPEIESRLQHARESIDPAKTIGALKLSSRIDELARGASLTANIASPTRKESGIFTTHTVRISCRNASLEQLINFAGEIRRNSPYLAMRRFKMNSDSRDPKQLSAEMEIESFELNQPLSR
ncbi:MAG TPA: hypothetical protein PKI32_10405 [Opitutales bacterium]|nr:hypothetical protein [Opitutales bacterium]